MKTLLRARFGRPIARVAMVAAATASGCHARPSAKSTWDVRFGPVLGNELIVGRVSAESRAWVLTGGNALVLLDLEKRTHVRSTLSPLEGDEHVWGLASTGDGTFWTLAGRTVLAQFQDDGRVVRRVALAQPHVGVFGVGQELLYQVMDFQPPADALMAGLPGATTRRPWGGLKTRALPLSRTSVAALNLVSCGPSGNALVPCWFPDQAAVTLVDADGSSREVQLEALPIVAPEVLLASDNPRRPIRDALVGPDGSLWVLGSGTPPPTEQSSRPGGWLLNRYDGAGRLRSRIVLPEPARLLLQADDDRCTLIAWDGRVVEVHT
jgi:hypothetical protein